MKQDKREIRGYIKQFSLEEVFSSELMEHFRLESMGKGEALSQLDEPLDKFYLLVEGKLKVYFLHENGKKILIRFYRPLSLVGDLEIFSGLIPNAIVETQELSTLISVPMDVLRKHTSECPKFLRFVINQLSHKFYRHSKASSLNLVYPLENRIASYLWSLSKITDDKQREEIQVNSLEEMADMLSTSYRHLTRVLTHLENKGVISRKRGKIKITDFEQLDQLSVGLFE